MTTVGAAFRLIRRKPVLLALALPAQAAGLLLVKWLAPALGDALLGMAGGSFAALALGCGAGMAVLGLLWLLVLQPAALQALRNAVLPESATASWFAHGMRSHWHKPLVVLLFQGVLMACLGLILWFLLGKFVTLQTLMGSVMVAASGNSTVAVLVLAGVFMLAGLLLAACCRLMLVLMTEMGFLDAVRTASSRWSWVWRMMAAQAVNTVIVVIIIAAFGAAHGWLTGALPPMLGVQTADERLLSTLTVVLGFLGSWTGFFALLAASLTRVFQPAYAFAVASGTRNADT